MKRDKVNELKNGLYRIYWKTGGTSIAAVGITYSGKRWMAPTNWTCSKEDEEKGYSGGSCRRSAWKAVKQVELIALS